MYKSSMLFKIGETWHMYTRREYSVKRKIDDIRIRVCVLGPDPSGRNETLRLV